MRLAEALGGTVVNADSMQVYRELRVLTARPTPEEEARAPHRLYGIVSAAESFSVGQWIERVRAVLDESCAQGRLPIVVGGTGLYFQALTEGLAPVPDIPDEVRSATRALLAALGPAGLHACLAERDPEGAARLRPTDPQRLARAWEVLEATGRPLSDWQKTAEPGPLAGLETVRLVLLPPRAELHARCDRRLERMVAEGALDEVQVLDALRLPQDRPAMRALGVPHLLRHIRGETSLEAALAAAQAATRRYVKRQTTWFRHRMTDWIALTESDPDRLAAEATTLVSAFDPRRTAC